MSEDQYVIRYQSIPSVLFLNINGMKKYIEKEAEIWESFLNSIESDQRLKTIPLRHGGTISSNFAETFNILKQNLINATTFNKLTDSYQGKLLVPPPSDTLVGQLIIGLTENEHISDAISVFLWFQNSNTNIHQSGSDYLNNSIISGKILVQAALAAEALPFRRTSTHRIAGAVRSAEAQLASLQEEVAKANTINEKHESELILFASNLEKQAQTWIEKGIRIQNFVLRRERRRRSLHDTWTTEIGKEVEKKFRDAEIRLRSIEKSAKETQAKNQDEFERLSDLFHSQLRLRAPVKLWETRAKNHKTSSRVALGLFILAGIVAILAGILIPYFAGDYISNSFFNTVCSQTSPEDCTREFSAKGPLTLAGLLVIMSILMWVVRLQYRIFLSERHLALDASEKKAFAETYLAIKEGTQVDPGSEAIVLASLFRPTQDGIIKDDEGGIDLSAAAMLARQLSKPGS